MLLPNQKMDFLTLCQWKLVSAPGTSSHFTSHRRGAAGTGKSSTIGYVERETAFLASYRVLRVRTHSIPAPLSQLSNKILKTFLETFKTNGMEKLTSEYKQMLQLKRVWNSFAKEN